MANQQNSVTINAKTGNKEYDGITPVGQAKWACVFTPNTKFDADGVYSCTLFFPEDKKNKAVKDFLSSLTEILDNAKQNAENDCKTEIQKGQLRTPLNARGEMNFGECRDDQGNPTGQFFIRMKAKAQGVSKKTGKAWKRVVPVYDASGHLIPGDAGVQIGNGSECVASISAWPYNTPMGIYGVKIQLQALQVKTLVPYNAAGDAKGYGFDLAPDDDENGYKFQQQGMPVEAVVENEVLEEIGGDY